MAVMQTTPKGCEYAQIVGAQTFAPTDVLQHKLGEMLPPLKAGVLGELDALKHNRKVMWHAVVDEYDRIWLVSLRRAKAWNSILDWHVWTSDGRDAIRRVTCSDCREMLEALRAKHFTTRRDPHPMTVERANRMAEAYERLDEEDVQKRMQKALDKLPAQV